ncbi:MAG: hypothetical protein ACP5N1_02515 [Candidatus Woesearchaeota archaeon]
MTKEKKQDLDLIIKKISLEEGKITELHFCYSDKDFKNSDISYTAKITCEDVVLKKNGQYVYPHVFVKMNKSNLKTYWELNHICGGSGDGDYTCHACEAKGSLLELNEKNMATLMVSAGYSKGLHHILTHLPTYCLLMENDINNTVKELYSTFKE